MLNLGTLNIGIKVDSTEAYSELSNVQDKIEDVSSTIENSDGSFSKVGDSISNLGDEANATSNKVSTLQIAMGNLIAKGVEKLASTITDQLGSAVARVDTLNNYVKTMENLGFATEAAESSIDTICDTIQPLPISLDTAVGSAQKYIALFGDIDKGTQIWGSIANMSFAAGQGTEVAAQAQDAWYKILAKGKPEADQWLTVTSAMPGQLSQLSQQLLGANATSQDLFEAWKNGTVTTQEVTDAINYLNENGGEGFASFAQQAQDANAGIGTSLENLKLAVQRNMANIIGVFRDEFVESSSNAVDAIDKIGERFQVVAEFINEHMLAVKLLVAVLGSAVAVYAAWTTATKIQAAAQALLNAVTEANPIALIITGVVALIAVLVTLYNNCEGFRAVVDRMKQWFIDAFNTIKNGIQKVVDAWNSFKALVQKAIKLAVNSGLVQTAISVVKKLIGWWNKLKEAAKKNVTFQTSIKNSGGSGKGHRIGAKEIPYDNYQAVLHKGERVLTAAENNQYTQLLNRLYYDNQSQGNTSKLSVLDIDYTQLANTLVSALSGVNMTIATQVDGRTVAQTTAPFMSTEINKLTTRSNRLKGVR